MKNPLERLQKISPDLENVSVITEPRGYDGWRVHLCFSTGKCADFSVDRGKVDDLDMNGITEKAIVKQLEYHKASVIESTR